MIKYVGLASLKPGADPEEAYNYWRGKHASWAKQKFLPEAKRYVINRVIHRFGEEDIFGFAEMWFDDMESALKAMGRVLNAPPDEFLTKWITAHHRVIVQEEDIEL